MLAALEMVLTFMKLTPLSGLASKIEQDLTDGKISMAEGVDLVALITDQADEFFPEQDAEIDLAHEIAVSVSKYMERKASQPPATEPEL